MIGQRWTELSRSRQVLLLAWVFVTGASLGTLVLSKGLGLVPCELCWYQRGLLYPQILILGVSLLLPSFRVALLAIPFSSAGLGVASYHSWLQLQPSTGETCSISNPCSEVTLEVAGLSIPNLSLLTFLLTLGLLVLAVKYELGRR